jgi:hypothetical protein
VAERTARGGESAVACMGVAIGPRATLLSGPMAASAVGSVEVTGSMTTAIYAGLAAEAGPSPVVLDAFPAGTALPADAVGNSVVILRCRMTRRTNRLLQPSVGLIAMCYEFVLSITRRMR